MYLKRTAARRFLDRRRGLRERAVDVERPRETARGVVGTALERATQRLGRAQSLNQQREERRLLVVRQHMCRALHIIIIIITTTINNDATTTIIICYRNIGDIDTRHNMILILRLQ
jgi:hypothetical protein